MGTLRTSNNSSRRAGSCQHSPFEPLRRRLHQLAHLVQRVIVDVLQEAHEARTDRALSRDRLDVCDCSDSLRRDLDVQI